MSERIFLDMETELRRIVCTLSAENAALKAEVVAAQNQAGTSAQTSRYMVAREVYQEFIDSTAYCTDTTFKLWCEDQY